MALTDAVLHKKIPNTCPNIKVSVTPPQLYFLHPVHLSTLYSKAQLKIACTETANTKDYYCAQLYIEHTCY